MKIIYSPQFERAYKKLPLAVKKKAEKQENIFRVNPFDSRLKTHKLSGKLHEFWSFSIDYSYRIVFEFGINDAVYFHDAGNHDVYK
jgi:mRNA-degrading endonuclease YafQ of YafQ-DinJ toxin-antitoxin module